MKKINCPIAIFYETHDDSTTVSTITALLPVFQKLNFRTFCPEDPKEMSKKDSIDYFEDKIDTFEQILRARSLDEDIVQEVLSSGHIKIASKTISKYDALKQLHAIAHEQIKYATYAVEILKEIGATGIQYRAIDISSSDEAKLTESGSNPEEAKILRNNHMAAQIHLHCKKGGVVALMGINHHNVSSILKNDGHTNVKSYYISNIPPRNKKVPGWELEYLLKGKDKKCADYQEKNPFDKIIDLYQYPELDPVEIIKQDLIGQPADEL